MPFEEGLVDPHYIGLDDLKRDVAMGKDRTLARLLTILIDAWWTVDDYGATRHFAHRCRSRICVAAASARRRIPASLNYR
jgi:hypothetical protein